MAGSLHERLNRLSARYPIDESLVFGLDVGIASIGSAVARPEPNDPRIEFAGSRCFEAPEDPKTKELKNKTRRDKRLLRRVVRRRRRRMADLRSLFVGHGLLESPEPEAFHHRREAPDPWRARAEGLDRALTADEFAAALLHIAKHRGFKSNRKSDRSNQAAGDDQRMLKEVEANKELSARYRTVGEMVAKDPKFAARKRNAVGDYAHTLARDNLRHEVAELFRCQRRLGNAFATQALADDYGAVAFHQRSLQDSEHLVGMCPFEEEEKRSAIHAPSFEKFRLLAKLNTVRVRNADGTLRRLTCDELHRAASDFGTSSKSTTWKALATKIGLPTGAFFDGIDDAKAKADVAATKGCAAGTKTIYDALGPAGWNAVKGTPAVLDDIAAVLAFRDDIDSIENGLRDLAGLDPLVLAALTDAARLGHFAEFRRAGHISAKAARNLVPHLLERKVYSDACRDAGYDHTSARRVEIDDLKNPVVQRSLREAVKQVETLIHHFGARPGRIVVELAREVGKSAEERDKITRGIEKRTAEKERRRMELRELLDLASDPGDEEVQRYELWKEQKYRCVYTDREIRPEDILSSRNAAQVDHVLPRSRSQDNGYQNKVLCLAGANQEKRRRTPWEWKVRDEGDQAWWDAFEARIRALDIKGMKKRNLLIRNFDERAQGFVERNLNDTKYAARALLSALRDVYADDAEPDPADDGYLGNTKRRLFARPGAITAVLRRAWGFGGFKDRADDRHHALDAIICASTPSDWLLNTLTRQYQNVEVENRAKWTPPVPPPWDGFREDAMRAYEGVFVSRSEKRRGRGQGHKDTIYAAGSTDGRKITYERKAVTDLKKGDLTRLKDAGGGNRPLAEALADWIDRGKPADDPPRSAKGDPVRKVSLERSGTSGFELNGGHVDNADMVRVDVFSKPNKRGRDEYYLVPIYRHHVMDKTRWPQPPKAAITRNQEEEYWEQIGSQHRFLFSLYPDAFVEVIKTDGTFESGYFRGANRNTNSISLSPHNSRNQVVGSIGVKTAHRISKFHIDRLGGKHEVERETRTWHGGVCT